MKSFKKTIKKISIVGLILMMFVCASCGDDSVSQSTSSPTTKATATSVSTQTAAPTKAEEPTTTPEATPTSEPTPTPEPLPEFTEDMKGKPFDEAYYDKLFVIFEHDYDDEDWTNGGIAGCQSSKDPSIEVWDEQLRVNSLDGENAGQWARYIIPGVFDFETYSQIEISMDLMTDGNGCIGTSVGLFTSSYIPDGIRSGSGFWFSPSASNTVGFNGLSSVEKGGWPTGFFSVDTPDNFATMKHLTIVVNEDMITIYMTTEAGEKAMIARVVLEDEAIVIYNKDGGEIFKGEHDSEKYGWIGTDFSIFSHFNLTTVDNMIIRGY